MQRDRILIVEDDAFLRDGLMELLERENIYVAVHNLTKRRCYQYFIIQIVLLRSTLL